MTDLYSLFIYSETIASYYYFGLQKSKFQRSYKKNYQLIQDFRFCCRRNTSTKNRILHVDFLTLRQFTSRSWLNMQRPYRVCLIDFTRITLQQSLIRFRWFLCVLFKAFFTTVSRRHRLQISYGEGNNSNYTKPVYLRQSLVLSCTSMIIAPHIPF